jgi:hypothetical protein
MNDKIKNLFNICGMPNEDIMEIYSDENKTFYMEKFAELIVKEILNISDEVITLSDSPEWLICERLGINHDWRRQDNFWS